MKGLICERGTYMKHKHFILLMYNRKQETDNGHKNVSINYYSTYTYGLI